MPHLENGHPRSPDLVRGLTLLSAIAIVIGDTIGTGVFLVSSDMARAAGSTSRVLAAWIIGGLIVLFGAFCYAELGAAFPKAGGPYVYLSRGLGPLWGFLFGWMSSFLERPVAMATLGAGFVKFMSFLFPVVARPWFIVHLGNYEFTFTTAQPLAALVVVLERGYSSLADHFEDGSDSHYRCGRGAIHIEDERHGCTCNCSIVELQNHCVSAHSARARDVGI
jgi:hypothetical protein